MPTQHGENARKIALFPKDPGGRPKAQLDLDQAERLAALGYTTTEIADFFAVCRATVDKRQREDPAFRAALDRGIARCKISLRRQQLKMAEEGNVAMLIFLGKNYLGQRDKWNVKHSGSGPQGEIKADPKVDLNKVLTDYIERQGESARRQGQLSTEAASTANIETEAVREKFEESLDA